jgi:hypothetical protein
MTENQSTRTLICSVVFLDIVEYSRQPVAQQIRLKDRFNALLSQALREIAVTDRIILDTGDGAAVSLIGDPQDAVLVATGFRDSVASLPPGDEFALKTRIGVNLGPVRLVEDINAQPNLIGDGINVAQRVMSFAQPGQILVSRSYHEVVSRLSDDYGKLFQYEGSRTDKHVREHEVYTVGATLPGLKLAAQAKRESAAAAAGAQNSAVRLAARAAENIHGKPRLATALAVIAILATAVAIRGLRGDDAAAVSANQRADRKQAAGGGTSAQAPGAKVAVVTLSIAPRGEVFVDGKKIGDSPPLNEFRITAGRHKIEIKNTGLPSHFAIIDAKPGQRISIKHKF